MTAVPTTTPTHAPTRPTLLNRRILASNLASGAAWLAILAVVSWPLALIGASYVVVGSVFLAAVYGREALPKRQEALAWAAPWLVAVALWACLAAAIGGGEGNALLALWFGIAVATPCYLGWQLGALAVRELSSVSRTARTQ